MEAVSSHSSSEQQGHNQHKGACNPTRSRQASPRTLRISRGGCCRSCRPCLPSARGIAGSSRLCNRNSLGCGRAASLRCGRACCRAARCPALCRCQLRDGSALVTAQGSCCSRGQHLSLHKCLGQHQVAAPVGIIALRTSCCCQHMLLGDRVQAGLDSAQAGGAEALVRGVVGACKCWRTGSRHTVSRCKVGLQVHAALCCCVRWGQSAAVLPAHHMLCVPA